MKNNKFLHLLGLTVASLTLTCCGGSDDSYTPLYEVDIAEMRLNYYSLALIPDETASLEVNYSPKAAFYHKASFKSSNEDVVRVDEKGNVEAREAGIATITVSAGEGDKAVSQEVRVYVGEKSSKTKDAATKQLNYQKAIGEFPQISEIHEVRDTEFFKEGVANKGAAEDTVYTISRPDGYLGFDGYESILKAPEGNREELHYGWAFMTGEDYISHLYHTYNGVKTRMSIPTQSYLGKERIECVRDIIDNLFTRGGEILLDQNISTVTESKSLAGLQFGNSYQYSDANNDVLIIKESDGGSTTIDADSETNVEIPADTKCEVEYTATMCWHNGVCVAEDIVYNLSYEIDGVAWKRNMTLRYSNKVNDDVNVQLPNNSEYRVVDSIYDL